MVNLSKIKNDVAGAAANAAASLKNGVHDAGQILSNQGAQSKAHATQTESAANIRAKVGAAVDTYLNFLDTKALDALRAPIKGMQTCNLARIEIKEEDTPRAAKFKTIRNKAADYHEGVVRKGEEISRVAGDKANALVRGVFTIIPVSAAFRVFGFLQAAKVVDVVVNTLAMIVGFAVRGALLAISQIGGHLAPYALVAGAIVAAATGVGFLAAKVTILAKLALPIVVAKVKLIGASIGAIVAKLGLPLSATIVSTAVLTIATIANSVAIGKLKTKVGAQNEQIGNLATQVGSLTDELKAREEVRANEIVAKAESRLQRAELRQQRAVEAAKVAAANTVPNSLKNLIATAATKVNNNKVALAGLATVGALGLGLYGYGTGPVSELVVTAANSVASTAGNAAETVYSAASSAASGLSARATSAAAAAYSTAAIVSNAVKSGTTTAAEETKSYASQALDGAYGLYNGAKARIFTAQTA